MDLKVAQLALNPEDHKVFPPEGKQYATGEPRRQLKYWVELIKKPANQKLSGGYRSGGYYGAVRVLETLRREYEMMSSFESEFHNSKHTKDAQFIITFMRKNKIEDFKELLTFLQKKWKIR
jgi:hypothetical protein